MGLSNSKNSWLCSDCTGGTSTNHEFINECTPIRVLEQVIVDYEITEFERCDVATSNSEFLYKQTANSYRGTGNSDFNSARLKTKGISSRFISKNASENSINLVDAVRNT